MCSDPGPFCSARSACLGGVACQLRRPATIPTRMIEPQLLEPQLAEPAKLVPKAPNAIPVRLLDTQARGHIGRRVLHQQPDGELTEDSVWRWSSAPDRYLDTALRLEVASNPDIRLVDVGRAPSAGRNAPRVESRIRGWDTTCRGCGVSDHGNRPGGTYPGGREPVSPSQLSYLATWPQSRAGSCAASPPRASQCVSSEP